MRDATIPRIFFTESAASEMAEIARQSPDRETGGLVLGRVCRCETGRSLLVTRVGGPGPRARLDEGGFRPDMAHYRDLLRTTGLRYLGEWHKHPPGQVRWSLRDLAQAAEIIERGEADELLCPICAFESVAPGVEQIRMSCFYLRPGLAEFLPVGYDVIAAVEEKPLRYAVVEDRVIDSFLKSRRPWQAVPADVDAEHGVARLYERPLVGNQRAVLLDGARCAELSLAQDFRLALVVRRRRGKTRVRGYEIAEDESREIEVETVSLREDMLSRNRSLLETAALREKKVALVGLGSIGSVAALELARAGLGRMLLVDPDILRVQNLCRHACDLSEVGLAKVDAVAARVRRISPCAEVSAWQQDANADPDAALERCADAHAILVSTDTENSRRLANWLAHRLNVPIVFAGLLERAVGGRVWRVVPGKSACYQCYPGDQEISAPGPVAYSEARSSRDLTVQPGLGNDIAFVTHLAVRYVIDALTGCTLAAPMLFWFNRAREGWCDEPLSLYKVEKVPANPDCPCCSGNPAKE